MKNDVRRPNLANLCCLLSIILIVATFSTPSIAHSAGNQKLKGDAVSMSPEERVVRSAYEKVTELTRAAQLLDPSQPSSEDSYLHFTLSNFKTGAIEEIRNSMRRAVINGDAGSIINLTRVVVTLNQKDEWVSYQARWSADDYAAIYDHDWTIGDLMNLEPTQYYDVGSYALYDVDVSFQGRSSRYRSLTLFHNPHGATQALIPSFWDPVVGTGGSLTEAWNEQRTILNRKMDQSFGVNMSGSETSSSEAEAKSNALVREANARDATQTRSSMSSSFSTSEGSAPPVTQEIDDRSEHSSGHHGERITFRGSCFDQESNTHLCMVNIIGSYVYENGAVTTWTTIHRNRVDQKTQTATGSRNASISCYAGFGVATRHCVSSDCTFNASLTGAGASMQMVGGDVWNGQLIHMHTCGPSTGAANCTAPGANGTCPPGSTINESGLCCGGTRADCEAAGWTWDFTSGTCQPNPFRCEPPPNACDYGYDWSYESCGCVRNSSPIVVDVLGNGFDLTDARTGVNFDLDNNGSRERLSWTAMGSDDAWLVLDRNGNAVVDSGQEMFGNFTLQPDPPAGEERNGFLALAEYDRIDNGGNGDGVINRQDSIFSSLRLWQDSNHNGISESNELHGLTELGLKTFDLDYRTSRRTDSHGNQFRYRGKVKDEQDAQLGRWAWDVFLTMAP